MVEIINRFYEMIAVVRDAIEAISIASETDSTELLSISEKINLLNETMKKIQEIAKDTLQSVKEKKDQLGKYKV